VGSIRLLHYTFSVDSDGERILKIGQYMAKLWARQGCPAFFDLQALIKSL